mmetsp:Transcript_11684/g.45512  ORF Transcript_11684/g.45512 Transcript_11684/m.45512 type:complete len:353 (+) Transcript_11684:961-2019(+)
MALRLRITVRTCVSYLRRASSASSVSMRRTSSDSRMRNSSFSRCWVCWSLSMERCSAAATRLSVASPTCFSRLRSFSAAAWASVSRRRRRTMAASSSSICFCRLSILARRALRSASARALALASARLSLGLPSSAAGPARREPPGQLEPSNLEVPSAHFTLPSASRVSLRLVHLMVPPLGHESASARLLPSLHTYMPSSARPSDPRPKIFLSMSERVAACSLSAAAVCSASRSTSCRLLSFLAASWRCTCRSVKWVSSSARTLSTPWRRLWMPSTRVSAVLTASPMVLNGSSLRGLAAKSASSPALPLWPARWRNEGSPASTWSAVCLPPVHAPSPWPTVSKWVCTVSRVLA